MGYCAGSLMCLALDNRQALFGTRGRSKYIGHPETPLSRVRVPIHPELPCYSFPPTPETLDPEALWGLQVEMDFPVSLNLFPSSHGCCRISLRCCPPALLFYHRLVWKGCNTVTIIHGTICFRLSVSRCCTLLFCVCQGRSVFFPCGVTRRHLVVIWLSPLSILRLQKHRLKIE